MIAHIDSNNATYVRVACVLHDVGVNSEPGRVIAQMGRNTCPQLVCLDKLDPPELDSQVMIIHGEHGSDLR